MGVWWARTTVGLVAAVLAVGVSVAPPLLVDALARATLHLAGRALGRRRRVAAAAGRRLVRLVLMRERRKRIISRLYHNYKLELHDESLKKKQTYCPLSF